MMTPSDAMDDNDDVLHNASAAPSVLEQLCDDALALILFYCDFCSAVRVARSTSRSLRRRLYRNCHQGVDAAPEEAHPLAHVWKAIHHRHGFSSSSSLSCSTAVTVRVNNSHHNNTQDGYLEQCRRGRQLDQNLFHYQRPSLRLYPKPSCFNLPHRRFHFVPILPPSNTVGWNQHDPPPVDFDCHSFQFTNMGCSGEYVLLNPLDDSLTICQLKHPTTTTPTTVTTNSTLPVSRGQVTSMPTRRLLSNADDDDDEANVHWRDYFALGHDSEEWGMWSLGVDALPILQIDANSPFYFRQVGTMVGYGRAIFRESPSVELDPGAALGYCIELVLWRWQHEEEGVRRRSKNAAISSTEKWICRFPWGFRALEICAMTNRFYLSFLAGDGPTHLASGRPILNRNHSGRWVAAFPFVRYNDTLTAPSMPKDSFNHPDSHYHKYSPDPLFILECEHDVATVTVDPSGTILLVGTVERTLEVWKILDVERCDNDTKLQGRNRHNGKSAQRLQILDIPACLLKAAQLAQQRLLPVPSDNDDANAMPVEEESQALLSRMPIPHPEPLEDLYHPKHLSLTKSGFVTLQHSRTDGSTLLVWMNSSDKDDDGKFDIVSQIQLPLSPQCKPSIHYDGRRLIVFGKDHIGMIILVYHVLTSLESIDESYSTTHTASPGGGDESAGITNWTTDPPRVRFVNRIRHVALGGFGSMDSLYMTCNARYIMVNTKTGHLWNAYHPDTPNSSNSLFAADGLLVIDLDDVA